MWDVEKLNIKVLALQGVKYFHRGNCVWGETNADVSAVA